MPGLLGGIARTAVIAGTATAVSNRVSRRQAARWSQQDQSAYAQPQYVQQPPPAPPPPAPSGSDDRLGQLERLADLKQQGILTEVEFETEKAKILAG
jgi:Short C-terminal domain